VVVITFHDQEDVVLFLFFHSNCLLLIDGAQNANHYTCWKISVRA